MKKKMKVSEIYVEPENHDEYENLTWVNSSDFVDPSFKPFGGLKPLPKPGKREDIEYFTRKRDKINDEKNAKVGKLDKQIQILLKALSLESKASKEKSGYGFLVNTMHELRNALETLSQYNLNIYQLDTKQYYIEINSVVNFKKDIYSKIRTEAFFYKRRTKNAREYIKKYNIEIKPRMIYLVDRRNIDHELCQVQLIRRVSENVVYGDIKVEMPPNSRMTRNAISNEKWSNFYNMFLDRLTKRDAYLTKKSSAKQETAAPIKPKRPTMPKKPVMPKKPKK